MNDSRTILLKYNVDINGNPATIKIDEEKNMISPLNYTIQLEQVPSEQNNIVVIDDTNKEMYEVDHLEDVNENSYYVNYHSGLVHFHPSKAGKTHIFSYYGKGFELIGASRIFDEHSYLGRYIFETLQELIDRGRECIDALNTIGNAVELLRRIENYIIVATELDVNLKEDIAIGQPLQISLHQDIEDANAFRVQLNKDVNEGKILQPILQKTVDDGNAINIILNASNANAQDSINLIRSAQNPHFDILTTDWATNTDTSVTAIYMKDIIHNLGTENIQITCKDIDSKMSIFDNSKTIDVNTTRFFTDSLSNIKVVMSAGYYDGGSDIGDEVKLARKGEVSLKNKIDGIDTSINALNNEIITARGSDLTLDERLDGIDSQLTQKAKQTDLDITNSNVASLQKKAIRISSRVINTVGLQSYDLGFRPKLVRIHATLKNNPTYDSDGGFNGTSYAALYRYGNGTLVGNSNTTGIIMLHSGSTYNKAMCEFTDTGFNLIWEVGGALPDDTILMIIEALG